MPRRPRIRGQCEHGPRPCPWFGCRYHLGSDEVTRNHWDQTVRTKITLRPELMEDGTPTCALDVAEQGCHSQRDVATLLGLSQPHVLRAERIALVKARKAFEEIDWFGE